MNENDLKIVTVTNISDFDFNGELGARFGGRDYLIPAGKSLTVPFHAGEHFAKHLAQAIIIKGAPIRTDKELAGKGSSTPLWNEESIKELMTKILSGSYKEEAPVVKSAEDAMVDKIKQLNETISEDGNMDASSISINTSESTDGTEIVYKDKAQIISELKAKGITFDPRSSKTALEALL